MLVMIRKLTNKVRNKEKHILLLALGQVLQMPFIYLCRALARAQALTKACLGPSTESLLVRPGRVGTDVDRDLRLSMIPFAAKFL